MLSIREILQQQMDELEAATRPIEPPGNTGCLISEIQKKADKIKNHRLCLNSSVFYKRTGTQNARSEEVGTSSNKDEQQSVQPKP